MDYGCQVIEIECAPYIGLNVIPHCSKFARTQRGPGYWKHNAPAGFKF